MRARPDACGWMVAAGIVSLARAACADAATAQRLFDRGRDLMLSGDFDAACPMVAESLRADFTPGTLFTLAECLSKQGKISSAVDRYQQFVDVWRTLPAFDQNRQRARYDVSSAELSKLKSRVPTIALVLPEPTPEGIVVTMDGRRLPPGSFDHPVRVDPGRHVLSTRAPGVRRTTHRVVVRPGERVRVALVVGAGGTAAPAPHRDESTPSVDDESLKPDGGARRSWAYAAGGVGVAGVVVGSIAGIFAMSKRSVIRAECDGTVCSDKGKDAADAGQAFAMVSNLGFAVGAAGIGVSAYLLLTAPAADASHEAGAGTTVVGLRGSW